MKEELSPDEARRLALRAQGLDEPSPRSVTLRGIRRVFETIGLVQIDSVNVLVRSHYLPLFSRLGPYRLALLEEAAYSRRRSLFEYWGHEASLIRLDLFPLFRWRMARAERFEGMYTGLTRFARENGRFIRDVFRAVEREGPLGAGQLEKPKRSGGGWWGWTQTKAALEVLFWSGKVTTASRRGFERLYDLTERVIPQTVQSLPVPQECEAQRALLRFSARALGIGTERDLRDYFRLPAVDAKQRIAELVESGDLVRVNVRGWRLPAYMAAGTVIPRRSRATALLSPFDSLVWERDRTHRLFGFHYRLELYTPSHKRVHGYYVLPFLWNGELVARVDLKADRASAELVVRGLHVEHAFSRGAVSEALEPELQSMAGWLGLSRVNGQALQRRVRAR